MTPVRIACRVAGAIAAIGLSALAACQSPPAATPQVPATPPTPASNYVRILPLPPKAKLADILVRDGQLVGEPDPTTPGDPSVRILHGYPYQAKELFGTLTNGGRRIASAIGTAYRLPGGAVLTYYEHTVTTGPNTSVGNVEIFIQAPGVPVSELRFYVPPSPQPSLPRGAVADDGGGSM